jgi:hypothetical protein
MKLPAFAGLALLGAAIAMATAAHAQLVHISATSDSLVGQVVGYPQDARPMGGSAKFDLYYDASVVGTDGIFTFNDSKKNYWTLSAAFNPYETDPNAPLYEVRNFSFPLQTMRLAPATENPLPGLFALTAAPSTEENQYFDFGLIPSGPPTALPVPPFTFGTNFNYFYIYWSEEGWEGYHTISGSLRNFSAEIITPIPEPSLYGLGGGIAALCCIVYHRRRSSVMVAA